MSIQVIEQPEQIVFVESKLYYSNKYNNYNFYVKSYTGKKYTGSFPNPAIAFKIMQYILNNLI